MHVGGGVRPREHALEAYAAACLKYVPNCWWWGGLFGHNGGVNEREASIGSGSGTQGGDLLVRCLRRGRKTDINLGEWEPHDSCAGPRRG